MQIKFKQWDAVKMPDDTVTDMVRSAVNTMMENGEAINYSLCGDTLVMVLNHGWIEVYVSKVQKVGYETKANEVITI